LAATMGRGYSCTQGRDCDNAERLGIIHEDDLTFLHAEITEESGTQATGQAAMGPDFRSDTRIDSRLENVTGTERSAEAMEPDIDMS
jgi:hypothetical protein